MRHSILLRIVIFTTFLFSCNTTEIKETKNIHQIVTDKCNQSKNIDVSKLKLGDVKNLDIYNGINYFNFGDSLNSYLNCLECIANNSDIDTCKIKDNITFLDKEWGGTAYFFQKKLIRLELKQKESSLTDIYEQLESIFGMPNLQKIKVINSTISESTPLISGSDKRQFKPYKETITEFLSAFKDDKEKNNVEKIRLTSLDHNEILEESKKNYYNGDPIRVNIKFFPSLDLECKWQSKALLQLNIFRDAKLIIGQDATFGDNKQLVNGYEIRREYETIVNLYSSNEIIAHFSSLKKLRQKQLDSLKKQSEKVQDRKILEKFSAGVGLPHHQRATAQLLHRRRVVFFTSGQTVRHPGLSAVAAVRAASPAA